MWKEIWKEFQILFKELITMVLKKKYNLTKQTHFILYMSKSEHCWWSDNSYTKKPVIKRLSQTTYNFSNILGISTNC